MFATLACPRTARVTLAALISACAALALYQYTAPTGHGLPALAIAAAAGKPPPPARKTLPPI